GGRVESRQAGGGVYSARAAGGGLRGGFRAVRGVRAPLEERARGQSVGIHRPVQRRRAGRDIGCGGCRRDRELIEADEDGGASLLPGVVDGGDGDEVVAEFQRDRRGKRARAGRVA